MPTESARETFDPARDPFDAIVIGGSYAGLSASLQLARTRRRILVIDAGVRRNRFAHASHGFLGQDGRAPADIAADGRAQLLAYPNVRWFDGTAIHAAKVAEEFAVVATPSAAPASSDAASTDAASHAAAASSGAASPAAASSGAEVAFRAKRLVLATGVIDELPDVEGLTERWGRSVFHCPYCHGYELQSGRIGVIAIGPASIHQALLLPDWGQVTLFTNDAWRPDEAERSQMIARGVTIEPAPITRVVDTATVLLADGRHIELDGLFVASRIRPASPLAEQLACAFEEGPLGRFIRTDAMKQTTIPGVFACGDAARGAGNVAFAVGDGAQAGVAAHRSMIFEH